MSRGKPVWNVVGLLLLGLLLTTLVELIDRQRQVSLQRQQIVSELARLVSELERQLAVLMPLGEPLARRLSSEPQLSSAQLQDSVEPLLAGHPRLVNVALSSGLRIDRTYPLRGNEAVLGMDYALRPEMMEGVRRAIEQRGTVFVGPFSLVQTGRLGLIARTPFFAAGTVRRPGELLGLVSVVIDLQGVFEDIGLLRAERPYRLAIRGREGRGERGEVFFGDPDLFQKATVQRRVRLPDGHWLIAAEPQLQAYPLQRIAWIRGSGLLLTLLLAGWLLNRPVPEEEIPARRLPLHRFLSRHLLLLLLPIVALQGWLSYQAARNAAGEFQKQLAHEIGERLQDKVAEFFEAPRRVLSLNAELARSGLLEVDRPEVLVTRFLLQLRQQPLLTFISLGTASGDYYAASRPPLGEDRALRMIQARQADGFAVQQYRVDDANRRGLPIERGNANFDARTRPWFRAARESAALAWYPAYRYAIHDPSGAYDAMGIGMAGPLYDAGGSFLGVITADVALVQLGRLLEKITRETGGVAFLAEADGKLLATSTGEPVYELTANLTRRIRTAHSENALVRSMGQAIAAQDRREGRAFREIGSERYLIDWWSYALPDGPTLTVGLALPQSRFVAPTSALLHSAVLVALTLLLLSLLAALLLSRWIAQPLAALSRWATRLGNGEWRSEKPQDSQVQEVALLGHALEHMARRLERHTDDLRHQVAERTAELEQANRELRHLSSTDGLTGLANRRLFDEVLTSEWARARRHGEPLALLMLDIDCFKKYNDRYGHLAGDDCLRRVAAQIRATLHRAGDLAARYGGEEFAVIAPGIDAEGAMTLAEAIRHAVEQQAIPHIDAPEGCVTVSIGVALQVPAADHGPEALIGLADQALYRAKHAGRNRVEANLQGDPQALAE